MKPAFLDIIRKVSNRSIAAPKVCVVGAGPAGFYAAQQLVKSSTDVQVDILERLPVPYGLVRYGVAPDHPNVKNVTSTFNKTAKNPRVRFLGNVNVGKDVSIQQLKENYNAVLLSYGAEEDKLLNIPGENLNNVISGRSFVGWYNGLPSARDLKIDLDHDEAVIIGQGNVAIDIARILLTPIDKLKNTDITSYALEQLSKSKVKKVWLVGRRGPLQVAFTTAELRELTRLEGCKLIWRPEDFLEIQDILPNLVRPRDRLTKLMFKSMLESKLKKCNPEDKELHPIFLRSPIEFTGSNSLKSIKFSVNKLVGSDLLNQTAQATKEVDEILCGLAFRSIGYKSVPIDPIVPFDQKSGHIVNRSGKVAEKMYVAGWLATGPTGVILNTMNNAFEVGSLIAQEIKTTEEKSGWAGVKETLDKKNVQVVHFEDWEKIDKEEIARGKALGKSREKIVDIPEMLNIASKSSI